MKTILLILGITGLVLSLAATIVYADDDGSIPIIPTVPTIPTIPILPTEFEESLPTVYPTPTEIIVQPTQTNEGYPAPIYSDTPVNPGYPEPTSNPVQFEELKQIIKKYFGKILMRLQ